MLNLLKNIVKRCRITLTGKDNGDFRVQQISANRKAIDAEIYAPYGMSYNVPVDSLCVYLQVGGDSGNLIVLPDRSQDRVKDLKPGEVAFFNPLTKTRTVYRENGDMEIVTEGSNGDVLMTVKKDLTIVAEGDVNITSGGVMNLNGDVNIDGALDVTGDIDSGATITGSDVKAGSIDLKTHRHVGSITAPTGSITPTGTPI